MKILTIGAGVIGVTYPWQLHKAEDKIIHLVRKSIFDLYRRKASRFAATI